MISYDFYTKLNVFKDKIFASLWHMKSCLILILFITTPFFAHSQTLPDLIGGFVPPLAADDKDEKEDPNIFDIFINRHKDSSEEKKTNVYRPPVNNTSASSNKNISRKSNQSKAKDSENYGYLKGKDGKPLPNKRPDYSYRNQRLPSSIYKKEYSLENSHLPRAVYRNEYEKILFDSAATGNLDVIRAMSARLGKVDIRDDERNTPLIYAAMAGNYNSMVVLLGADADPNANNRFGVYPIHVATKLNRPDIIDLLISKGADVNVGDSNNTTALMTASQNGYVDIVRSLLKDGARMELKDSAGNTALHMAILANKVNIAYLLVTAGASVETRNFHGYTPLMLVAQKGSDDLVSLLLNAGADVNKTDVRGNSALKIAKSSGNEKVAILIDSEKIRRDIYAAKLLKMRKNDDVIAPTPIERPSINNVASFMPVPRRKPWNAKSGAVPVPHFSIEQEKYIKKRNDLK
ncbi:ankyrin repeat domain-containing protein [Rickettsiales bacterium]|nr:ankyrin repeat domain-containing protein [Rickettsiales bacterium]